MLYRITHATVYEYSEPVDLGHNLVHLQPRSHPRQVLLESALDIDPPPAVTRQRADFFGNPVCYFTVQQPHRRLAVTAQSRVDVTTPAACEPSRSHAWSDVPGLLRAGGDAAAREAYSFAFDSPYVPRDDALAEYAAPSFPPRRPLLEAVLDLTARIHGDFRYDARATTVTTPVRELLTRRAGVCQDFAHLQIGCLRSLGLAARYVSGYVVTNPPPGRPRLVGADASHAWLAVYCPTFGWVDFDPTNNQVPADRHITLAWGRDYNDVTPVRGIVLGGGQSTLRVSVDVTPVDAPG
jgi:transglutaminase-like putative cysteine protease